ncbi:MAG: TonB-dependent receptor [Pseudomonadota bacterium]
MNRRTLKRLLLVTTFALSTPAFAQVAETPNENPAADAELQPPQSTPATPATDTPPVEGEVVVTGRFIPDVKRETSEIVSVLDQAALQRTGDSDIGAALSRVTGLSLVDGRFVYVRGLGGRYSSAILDGSVLPSPEPLRRIVPLDVFPTELLSGAVIQKTYSVEFPGEFGGGLVQLKTLAIPRKPFFEIGGSAGYNDASTFKSGFSFEGGDFDSLGFGDFHYELPDAVRLDPTLTSLTPVQLQRAGRSLVTARPRFSIDRQENRPDLDINATGGTRFDLLGMRAGIVGAFSLSNQIRNNFGVRNRFGTVATGLEVRSSFAPAACAGFNPTRLDASSCGLNQTIETAQLGGIVAFGLDLDDRNKLKVTSTIVRKADKIAQIQRGRNPIDDSTNVISDQRIAFIEQELWVNQLTGDHRFDLGQDWRVDFDWRGSYARASRVTPFLTSYRYVIGPNDAGFSLAPQTPRNSRRFTALVDDNYEGGADLKFSGDIGGLETVIKLGGQYNKKEREYASRSYSFIIPGTAAGTGLLTRVPEIIFSPDNIGPGGLVLTQTDGPANSFLADQESYAGYGALELQLTEQVRLTGGVRYEHSEQTVNGAAVVGTVPASNRCTIGATAGFVAPIVCTLKQGEFLPAATATWEFARNMQLRAGYSKTLSRPDLRELSPAVILNVEEDVEEQGDPTLNITKIDNYDARYEWYFGKQQIFSLGGFYKKFDNPIERSLSPFGDGARRIFINAAGAELYGGEVELELTAPLGEWIGGENFFTDRRVFVIGNFTYSKSSIDITPAQAGILTSLSRPLEGQSKYLGNLQVGFEKTGERWAFLFNYASKRISDVGSFGVPDVIEKPPITLDFVTAKAIDIGGKQIELSFKASNIIGEEFRRTQGGLTYENYPLGRSFSLGAKTRF